MTQSGGGMASKVVSVLTFTACDDELRVDGRVTTASSEGYTVVSKTTCK